MFAARLLTSAGMECTHEAIFNEDDIEKAVERLQNGSEINSSYRSYQYDDWAGKIKNIEAEASLFAAPYLDHSVLDNTKVIHLIRHPLKVISSFLWDFIYFSWPPNDLETLKKIDKKQYKLAVWIPELDELVPNTIRACYYWTRYNEIIEEKSVNKEYLLHRVDIDPVENILDFCQIENRENLYLDNRTNTKRHRLHFLTLDDIPNHPVKDKMIQKAEEYGYDLNLTHKKLMF